MKVKINLSVLDMEFLLTIEEAKVIYDNLSLIFTKDKEENKKLKDLISLLMEDD